MAKFNFRQIVSVILLVSLVSFYGSSAAAFVPRSFNKNDPTDKALQLLSEMGPEERIGQLFLVTFKGSTAELGSQIYELITNYHVGGVVLNAGNDNFVAAPDTISETYQLITQLQSALWSNPEITPTATSSSTPTSIPTIPNAPSNYIPLFIGISQGGDGYPLDQIQSGLTRLPDLMAIGATWDPTLAEQVGEVSGEELSNLGFNLFFGPSLDVLESPGSTLGNGLGASVFGGDPYWVGAMGSSYISGLHSGSNGRLVVVADHFPGRGSADRPMGEEPATVRKSLEQLKQIELAPFFTVTGNAVSAQGTADGLMVSHIRYQGFQGNIRSTTRPVSFDKQALSQILSLTPFTTWRDGGGLLISDDLGSQTVKTFYDPSGQSFLARLVARDAFLAGNDLLFMGDILSSDAPDNYTTVTRTIEFFVQKYLEDSAFAQRVDDSVVRILAAKFRVYGEFEPKNTIPQIDDLKTLGQSEAITLEVARKSATLVNPSVEDLDTVLPSPPVMNDRIVFLTDTRQGRQCGDCLEEAMLPVDALKNAILRLYGPQTGGQVQAYRLIDYSLSDTESILEGGAGNQDLEDALQQAKWVVINMLDAEPGATQTILLRRFLSERQDLLRDKQVIVFAFNAPYYLDATDISKITAYYCLYSKSSAFVEVAARLLFRELSPEGNLPVSVSGIGYDLLTATSPDPNQVIQLTMEQSTIQESTPSATAEATVTPSFHVGDTVSTRTNIILDHNGHPVPDGTGVRFSISLSSEGGVVQQIDASTLQGVAGISFSIDRPGLLEIRAESYPALTSVVVQLDVSNEGYSITIIAPTPSIGYTPTPEVIETADEIPPAPVSENYLGAGSWLLMVVLMGGFTSLSYSLLKRNNSTLWTVRKTECIVTGGLLAYTYLAIRLPGSINLLQESGWLGIAGCILIGALAGYGIAYSWQRFSNAPKKQSS